MTHYQTMGLDRGCTAAELLAKWRELSRTMHPDRLGCTPEANAAFAEVTAAYAVLSDAGRRKAYDASLDLLTEPCPKCSGEGRVWKQKGFTGRMASMCKACGGSGRIERS